MLDDRTQKIIDNMTIGDLRFTRNQLNEQIEAINNEFTYIANYYRKHPPHKDETEQQYTKRMMMIDHQNPSVFFANVFEYSIGRKNTR